MNPLDPEENLRGWLLYETCLILGVGMLMAAFVLMLAAERAPQYAYITFALTVGGVALLVASIGVKRRFA